MKTTTTKTRKEYCPVWELSTVEEELNLCEVVCRIKFLAMHRGTGDTPVIDELIRGLYLDKVWSEADLRQTTADTIRTKSKQTRHTKEAEDARKVLKNILATDEARAWAEATLDHYTTLADSYLHEAQDIEKKNEGKTALTASLARDTVHEVWLELQAIKADPDRQTPEAFGELCDTAEAYIRNMTSAKTIDGTDTIRRPLSREEAIYLMSRYGADPGARPRTAWRQTAKGCTGYYTLEPGERKKDLDLRKVDPETIANYAHYNEACLWYYENITLPTTHSLTRSIYPHLDAKTSALSYWERLTKAQKYTALGLDPAQDPILYLVLHVATIRTHHSTEEMTDHDPRTAEAIIEATLASVDILALAERANLGTQAREVIAIMADENNPNFREVYAKANTARKEHLERGKLSIEKLQADRATAGKKPYTPGKVRQMLKQNKTASEHTYQQTLWREALTLAGYSTTGQREAKRVITSKLSKAYRTAPDELTPGQIDYASLMRKAYRGNPTSNTNRLDLVEVWTALGEQTPKHRPEVIWIESGHTPEAITPGKDYREAEVLLRDSYRQTAPKATPPALTPKEARERNRLEEKDKDTLRKIALYEAYLKEHPWLA